MDARHVGRQRHIGLAEELVDAEPAGDRQGVAARAAEAGRRRQLQAFVRSRVGELFAILGAEVDGDRFRSPGALEAFQNAAERGGGQLLNVGLTFDRGRADVGGHLGRDRSETAEDVNRHAGRSAGSAGGRGDGVEGVTEVGDVGITGADVAAVGLTPLIRDVVVPAAPNLATQAEDHLEIVVVVGGRALAQFASAATDDQVQVVRSVHHAVGVQVAPVGGGQGSVEPRRVGGGDQGRAGLSRKIRVGQRHEEGVSEDARWGDLLAHVGRGERHPGVGLHAVVDLVAADGQTAETLQRGLVVVERVEVEDAAVGSEGAVAAELERSCTHARDGRTGRDGGRRTASGHGAWTAAQRIGRRSGQRAAQELEVVAAGGRHDTGVAERPGSELDAFTLVVVQVQGDVAAAVTRIGADRQVGAVGLAVLVACHGVAGAELDALEVVLEDEVQRARDGVRAINGRGAAGDDVDPLQEGGRDARDVDDAVDVVGGDALAVDQDQVAVGAEAPQVDRRHAGGAVVDRVAVAGLGDGQVADDLFDFSGLLQADFLGAQGLDRAGRHQARRLNARTGDDDDVQFGLFVLRSRLRHRGGGHKGRGGDEAGYHRGSEKSATIKCVGQGCISMSNANQVQPCWPPAAACSQVGSLSGR